MSSKDKPRSRSPAHKKSRSPSIKKSSKREKSRSPPRRERSRSPPRYIVVLQIKIIFSIYVDVVRALILLVEDVQVALTSHLVGTEMESRVLALESLVF